ncbi:MAG: hypothetical protein QOG84_2710 [Sphingomonadales bacterium]|nr:hypothetical protein [Sphingomonadales bacterium]
MMWISVKLDDAVPGKTDDEPLHRLSRNRQNTSNHRHGERCRLLHDDA